MTPADAVLPSSIAAQGARPLPPDAAPRRVLRGAIPHGREPAEQSGEGDRRTEDARPRKPAPGRVTDVYHRAPPYYRGLPASRNMESK